MESVEAFETELRRRVDRVEIERTALRYRVSVYGEDDEALQALLPPATFLRTNRRKASRAFGFAADLAAWLECRLVDRTGALSETDAVELVTACGRAGASR